MRGCTQDDQISSYGLGRPEIVPCIRGISRTETLYPTRAGGGHGAVGGNPHCTGTERLKLRLEGFAIRLSLHGPDEEAKRKDKLFI